MTNLSAALGKKFAENKDAVRIRTFELGGHTFKVKVPLTVESDAIAERIKIIDTDLVEKYYQESIKEIVELKNKKDANVELPGVEYLENDIVVHGRSMREAANMKVSTELRITEMIKLLVPEEKDFDMATITYADIEEIFPLPIQLALVEEITNTISFDYSKTKEK